MRALLALTRVEWLLFLRNPTMLFMALLLPSGLLLLQAYIIPGTRTPLGQGGLSAIDHLVVLALVVGATSVAITNYPSSVAGYRENGVLRKLDTTPAGPFRLLLAQWIIALISLVAAAGLALAIASVSFGLLAPRHPGMVLAVFVGGSVSMMALGSLIAARAASAQIAYGVGLLVFMLSLFAAGLWTPGPLMPDALEPVVGLTPAGAMAQSLQAAWFEADVSLGPLAVFAVWTAGCALIAARIFRWR